MKTLATIEVGIDSFISTLGHRPETRLEPQQVMKDFIDRIAHADVDGLDVFGVGEHHREEFLDSTPIPERRPGVMKLGLEMFTNAADAVSS